MTDRPDLLRAVSSYLYDAMEEHGPATAATLFRYVKNNHGDRAAGHAGHILGRMVKRGAVTYDVYTGHYTLKKRISFGGKK